MTNVLTEAVYLRRIRELEGDRRSAQRGYSEAALHAATNDCPENVAAQREARDCVADIEERIKALNTAWERRQDQVREEKLDVERQEFAATTAEIASLRDECNSDMAEAAEHFDKAMECLERGLKVRDRSRLAIMPWHRKKGSAAGSAMMELTKPLTALAHGLLARLAGAGLPIEGVAQHEVTRGSVGGLLSGQADEHLFVLQSLSPDIVRDRENV